MEQYQQLEKFWNASYYYFFVVKIDRSCRNVEKYKWKWMALGALGCVSNADFERKQKLVNDVIALDVFIICQKLRHK